MVERRAFLAELVAIYPIYLPIFERLDAEVAHAEAIATTDPVARAMAVARAMDDRRAGQKEMA